MCGPCRSHRNSSYKQKWILKRTTLSTSQVFLHLFFLCSLVRVCIWQILWKNLVIVKGTNQNLMGPPMCVFLILTAATPACTAWGEHGEQQLKFCDGHFAEQNTHETSKTSPQHASSPRAQNTALYSFLLPKQTLTRNLFSEYLCLHVKVRRPRHPWARRGGRHI